MCQTHAADSAPARKARGFLLPSRHRNEEALAALQAVPGARLIARPLYADHDGFAAMLKRQGADFLPKLLGMLARESYRRAGWLRSWDQVVHASLGTKRCRECLRTKVETDFPLKNAHCRKTMCKACENARDRREYWADPETHRDRARQRRTSRRSRELNRAAVDRYRARHPERRNAHVVFRAACVRGEITRPECCQAVGCSAPAQHAHHRDYTKPLSVDHLCTLHHEHVHHFGRVELKPGGPRKFARAPAKTSMSPRHAQQTAA